MFNVSYSRQTLSLLTCVLIIYVFLGHKQLKSHQLRADTGYPLESEVKAKYDLRKQRLDQSCKTSNTTVEWHSSMQMISSPKQNLVVCVVQKAGSGNWHETVWNNRETSGWKGGLGRKLNLDHSKNLPTETKLQLMNSYNSARVITVRHPFARLLSGWNQKFSKGITKKYMSNQNFKKYSQRYIPDNNHVLSFRGFLEFVVDTKSDQLNAHFRTIEDLCEPCSFPYNYIVKAETAPVDSWFVTDKANTKLKEFSSISAGVVNSAKFENPMQIWRLTQTKVQKYFQDIPRRTKEELIKKFQMDFERFGYGFDLDTNIPTFVD